MREIKFRAWIKDLEIWEDDFLPNAGEPFSEIFIKNDYIFCQYTGFKDKNGKEIYEGDIIKNDYLYMKNSVVEFNNGVFGFETKYEEDVYFLINDFSEKWYEVIGNKYQNPGLLK